MIAPKITINPFVGRSIRGSAERPIVSETCKNVVELKGLEDNLSTSDQHSKFPDIFSSSNPYPADTNMVSDSIPSEVYR